MYSTFEASDSGYSSFGASDTLSWRQNLISKRHQTAVLYRRRIDATLGMAGISSLAARCLRLAATPPAQTLSPAQTSRKLSSRTQT